MTPSTTTDVLSHQPYERLQELAARAGISVYRLADEAGVRPNTLYGLGSRTRKGHQQKWSDTTLHALSIALAERLGENPSQIYARLTGLDERSPRSPSNG